MGKKLIIFIALAFLLPISYFIAYFWAIKRADAKFQSLTNGQESYLNNFFTVENKAKGGDVSLLLKILTKDKKSVYLLYPLGESENDKKFIEAFEKVQNDSKSQENRQKPLQILLSMGLTFNKPSEKKFLRNFNSFTRFCLGIRGQASPLGNYLEVLKDTKNILANLDNSKANFLLISSKTIFFTCKVDTKTEYSYSTGYEKVQTLSYSGNVSFRLNLNSTEGVKKSFQSLLYLNRTKLETSEFYSFADRFPVSELSTQVQKVKESEFLSKMKTGNDSDDRKYRKGDRY